MIRMAIKPIQDFECGEFHIIPTLTYSYPTKEMRVKGFALALEWGFWAVMLVIYRF